MATLTLLQMVQNILSSMSSDQVNSIGDTLESEQVAQIIQNKYYDIVARGDLTLDEQLFQFTPSNDPTIPVSMSLPAGVARVDWLKYYDTNPFDNTQTDQFGAFSHDLNVDLVSSIAWTTTSTSSNTISTGSKTFVVASSTLPATIGQTVSIVNGNNSMTGTLTNYVGTTMTLNVTIIVGSGTFSSWILTSVEVPNLPPGYKYVTIVPIDYFIDSVSRLDLTMPEVFQYTFSQGGNDYTFRGRNDVQPSICTVISNEFALFDAFDHTQDSTLQASKTMAFGQIVPPFLLQDDFIPTLDDQQFPLLLNEAKSWAFYELKQMPHQKADQEGKRQWTVTQARKSKTNKPGYFDQLANYGRIPRTGGFGGYPAWRFMRNSQNFGSSI